MPDPAQPPGSEANPVPGTSVENPSKLDTEKTPVGAAQATEGESSRNTTPPPIAAKRPWAAGKGPVAICIVLAPVLIFGLSMVLVRGFQRGAAEVSKGLSKFASSGGGRGAANGTENHQIDRAAQEQAETLLSRVATGDAASADRLLAESDDWTGKTHRTRRTEQLITASLNLNDARSREAAIQAQLALDAVPRTQAGAAAMVQAVGDPNRRAWALWMLGALGNRGVDPVHTAKIIGAYLNDPNVSVRASSVDALSLVGTDETVPMLLDRFRNDPSPVVQEHAACDIAEAGMYTHEQRMTAAASLIGWLDDSQLTAQQRTWAIQALGDISGKNFGTDSAAWQSWYAGTH